MLAAGQQIVVAGSFRGALPLYDGGSSLSSSGAVAGFVVAMDHDGAIPSVKWKQRFEVTGGRQHVTALAIDGDEVVVAGDLAGSAKLGSIDLPQAEHALFVSRLALSDGGPIQGMVYPGDATANALALGPSGERLITGWFKGALNVGGAPLSAPGEQIFTAVLERDGAHRASQALGGSGENRGQILSGRPDRLSSRDLRRPGTTVRRLLIRGEMRDMDHDARTRPGEERSPGEEETMTNNGNEQLWKILLLADARALARWGAPEDKSGPDDETIDEMCMPPHAACSCGLDEHEPPRA